MLSECYHICIHLYFAQMLNPSITPAKMPKNYTHNEGTIYNNTSI